jgi:hypothetical protein
MPDEISETSQWQVDIANDVLYRKVDPDHWDSADNTVEPAAFQDPGKNYPDLSFFVKRVVGTPDKALDLFTNFPATRNTCGLKPDEKVTPEIMFNRGYRIAEIPASEIVRLGLQFKVIGEGMVQITSSGRSVGHVDVVNGKKEAIELSESAKCLTKEETFR